MLKVSQNNFFSKLELANLKKNDIKHYYTNDIVTTYNYIDIK